MQRLGFGMVMMSIIWLSSCTEAQYPIDPKPLYKIDKKYVGTWQEQKEHQTYVITKIDDYHYKITTSSKKGGTKTYYKAYTSMVNSCSFANISEIQAGKVEGYAICRLMEVPKNSKQIAIAFVKDSTISKLGSSDELKSYINAHINTPNFYSDTGILVRVK